MVYLITVIKYFFSVFYWIYYMRILYCSFVSQAGDSNRVHRSCIGMGRSTSCAYTLLDLHYKKNYNNNYNKSTHKKNFLNSFHLN